MTGGNNLSPRRPYQTRDRTALRQFYASSFHPMGVAFYRKLGLKELGDFQWRFHKGLEWLNVTEVIFGKTL